MIISHKYKFIFIKTHKTASTSVCIDLGDKCADTDIVSSLAEHDKENEIAKKHRPRNYENFKTRSKNISHITIEEVRSCLKNEKIFNNYFKFCVEREPVDKMLSHFLWHHRERCKDKLFWKRNVDFIWQEWVKIPMQHRNYNFDWWTIDGELAVDKILRYENLNKELKETCKNLGFDIELTSKAKASHRRGENKIEEPIITKEQIEFIYDKHKYSNKFTGYKIEDCKYYEN